MTKQEQFFYDHAGYSFNPDTETAEQGKVRCAQRMAIAETWALTEGFYFRWENDFAVDHTEEFGYEPSTCEYCQMLDENDVVVGSLGCIDDATSKYRRVVQAELALEAMPNETK